MTARKFNRKTEQLKARVLFVRGRLQKKAGEVLTDAEADELPDEMLPDLTADYGPLEIIERQAEPAADAAKGDPAKGDGGKPGK